ncbi:CPBP family intramembrane glutamic endopeptidase [Kribbella sp. NPDC005582]|uniref:CPBP family intramembrane glutamic endopeptidase n=1 Tax=Kribbella sp. NPDC005582 TaxID=3156893 RepID=UPI0033A9494E
MRRWVLVGGIAVLVGAAVVLVLTGNTGVRYTADSDSTQPMWVRWIPVAVGIGLVRLLPWRLERTDGGTADRRQAWILTGLAVAFAVLLKLLGLGMFEVLKGLLLLLVPLAVFRWLGGKPTASWPTTVRWAPAVPVAAFLLLSYTGPLAAPVPDRLEFSGVELALVIVGGFLANSVLEEVFYRRWLQTRWEQRLGPWPAILIASIAWAVWHVTLQGRGEFGIDLASVLVNQGVQGLFLGYLWSRYRRMWPLITVHGAINAVPIFLSLG